MKQRLMGTLLLGALAQSPALAAPPLPIGTPSPWSGFYAGLSLGGVTATATTVPTNGFSVYDWAAGALSMPYGFTAPYRAGNAGGGQAGVIGGLQFGYAFAVTPSVLIGVETDFQGTSLQGSGSSYSLAGAVDKEKITHLQNGLVNASSGIGWIGTARGRIGYLIQPSLLVFATGGFAYGDTWAAVNSYGYHWHPAHEAGHPENPVTPTSDRISRIGVGWTAGGGAEWMFIQNWSAKAEALYYDLGSQTVSGQYSPLINPAAPGSVAIINAASTRFDYQGVIARLGVNYHFAW
ncbi:MAG: outer membrane protein [Methylocystis sp.]|uniref:outer membrane protein n=1 Tax=Methylocystis sp. TaxID=1911079 RepID=UPI003DA5D6F6